MQQDTPIAIMMAEHAQDYKKNRDIVVRLILDHPERLEELWLAMEGAPTKRIRLAALSALDYITREQPALTERLSEKLLQTDLQQADDGQARHFANMLGKLPLDDSRREQVLNQLYDLYQSERAIAVRVFALQSLFDLMVTLSDGPGRLRKLLGFAIESPSPAMHSRAKKLLQTLDKMEKK